MIQNDNNTSLVSVRICAPSECAAADLRSFARFVRKGKQITANGLELRIAVAAWLGFAWIDEKLGGVAALKNPRPAYQKKVFSAAHAATIALQFPLEFGWVHTAAQFRGRGIATALLGELLAKNSGEGIFATTNAENHIMQKILRDSGFEMAGQPFPSDRTDAINVLWVKRAKESNLLRPDISGNVLANRG
jgi:GNAT superfamily N-acetyltransferase